MKSHRVQAQILSALLTGMFSCVVCVVCSGLLILVLLSVGDNDVVAGIYGIWLISCVVLGLTLVAIVAYLAISYLNEIECIECDSSSGRTHGADGT